MEFNYAKSAPEYFSNPSEPALDSKPQADIEEPIVKLSEMGQSVTEGSRFGNFIQSAGQAIRSGVGKIELQTQMGGGGEAVGAEAYGKDARQALREMAKVNKVQFTSVHTPTQVGNISGYRSPNEGFNDEQRKAGVEEIKKAVDFAADVTGGGSIVVHTGEYPRAMSEQKWSHDEKTGQRLFLAYDEEPGRAVTYMVDNRTGRIISDVRKSQLIIEPQYREADHSYNGVDLDGKPVHIKKGDWVTLDNKKIDETNPDHLFKRVPEWDDDNIRFKTKKLDWNDIEARTQKWNREHPEDKRLPEEIAYRIQLENQILQYKGHSLYHGRSYKGEAEAREKLIEAYDRFKRIEKDTPIEEQWKMLEQTGLKSYSAGQAQRFVPTESKLPSEIIKEAIEDVERGMTYTHEASASADAQAALLQDTLDHVEPVSQYAKKQSFRSLAESGIHAMAETKAGKHVDRDIFIAPENIFPEMGYGSHPDELIELVRGSRDEMVKMLTEKKIEDPNGVRDKATGELKVVHNPHFRQDISKEKAKELAYNHIKSTFDTQHLGMWRKHFVPQFNNREGRMETKEETDKRFNVWFMDQVKKMHNEGIIGELHIVDSMGASHQHLPAGQGIFPVVEAVEYLKKQGFDGPLISEGHGEEGFGQGRIITETWKAFGTPIQRNAALDFGSGGGGAVPSGQAMSHYSRPWTDVQHSYFSQLQTPYYTFGSYAPSNDWTLWSQLPME